MVEYGFHEWVGFKATAYLFEVRLCLAAVTINTEPGLTVEVKLLAGIVINHPIQAHHSFLPLDDGEENGRFFKYNKNIDTILKESTNIWFEKDRPLAVTLEVSAECAKYFKNKTYFPLQKVEKELKDGRVILSCKAAKEEEILPTVLHWLPHIKVLAPAGLHTRVKEVLNHYLKCVK